MHGNRPDQCPPPDMEADPETQWVTFNAVAAHAHEQAIELLTKGSCQVVTTTDNLQSHERPEKVVAQDLPVSMIHRKHV